MGVLFASVICVLGTVRGGKDSYDLLLALLYRKISVISEFLISNQTQKFKGDHDDDKNIYTYRFQHLYFSV